MLRAGEALDKTVLLVRATPADVDEAVIDIAESALEAADTYVVDLADGSRVRLYGVSVFARAPGVEPRDVLRRFASAPRYVEASAGQVRAAGFDVLATGANPMHFDVLLIGDQTEARPLLSRLAIQAAACRLVDVCGDLRPNAFYAGDDRE